MNFLYQLLGEIGQTGVGAKDRKHSKRPHEEDMVDWLLIYIIHKTQLHKKKSLITP